MSYFALSYVGTQNYLRDVAINSQADTVRSGRELGYLALPPLPLKYREVCKVCAPSKLCYSAGNKNSYGEYMRLRTKHLRCPEGPLELYLRPAISSQKYGWFHKCQYPTTQYEPWTRVTRYPKKESEMTKFVDYMKRVHKEILLW